ncbi:TonB-dependent siderophore receptor [Methylomonas rivi]|uniref:TonB-dependent receptor n=1 Tax=Methylomonas rivi TaxID=2952226 RepID=A0ABT1TZX3_9GAMM|nr:TonB-dependent receptor [Methylomonas sp. WSC-6]MCQ8127108.1 TonB-dependent receptor [Methylomonas sp. WSC-6]
MTTITTGKRQLARQASALILGTALMSVTAAEAAETSQPYSIPPGSLAGSLNRLAETSGLQLIYDSAIAEGLSSKGLSGNYTPAAALQQLLRNTGLTYRLSENGNVVIERQPLNYRQDPAALPAVKVVGKATYDSTDPYNPDYSLPNASTATKTDTPIMETPFSIQVVSKQVLQDQQVTRLEQALKNVSGVTIFPGNQGFTDSFMMRGFLNDTTYRDGVLLPTILGGGTTKREVANLERVEVLKGPGSILFGRAEPGGIINLVTKQPLSTPYYSMQQQFGSYDFYRTTIDATAPLTDDNTLLYRLNIAYENTGSFRNFVDNERVFVAPVLKWNISEQTQATFEMEYQHFNESPDPGIPPLGNRPANVPIETALHEPLVNKNDGDRVMVGFNWSHQFNDDWKLSHRFTSEFFDFNNRTLFFGAATANGSVSRSFNLAPETESQRYMNTVNLSGKLATGFAQHTLLFGFDHFQEDDKIRGNCCTPAPAFNIFNPVYLSTAPQLNSVDRSNYTQSWYGLYFQDQIELPYGWHLLGGFRYDNAEGENHLLGRVTSKEDRISPRGGVLWQALPWLSLYGSYTENFGPSSTLFRNDNLILPPQSAQQWEAGLKTEFWDGQLRATLAYFELTKQNIRVPGTTPPLFIPRAVGEAESHGIEFEVTGEILPGWNVITAYAYTPYAKITKDNTSNGGPGNTGKRLFLAPEHSGSVWSTYEFQNTAFKGLKFGAGVVGLDQRQGDSANTYQLPGFLTVGLMTSYEMQIGKSKVTTQLNVDNLLNKEYYAGSNSGNFITIGAPRSFMGSIRVEY